MIKTWNSPKNLQIWIYWKLRSLMSVTFTVFELLNVFWAAGKNDPPDLTLSSFKIYYTQNNCEKIMRRNIKKIEK